MNRFELATDRGTCPVYEWGDAAQPSVLVYLDGLGMRPALQGIAGRIAAAGYHVLLPDLFYPLGPYTPPEPRRVFEDAEVRQAWFAQMLAATPHDAVMRDTERLLAGLPGPVAITGYCMGARLALIAAGTFPARIVAAAAFHPGRMVTDAADSPHRIAAGARGRLYIAAAADDPSFPDEHQRALAEALAAGGVRYGLETYPARHGWVPRDTPVHDPVQAARHDAELLALLAETLG